MQTQTESIPHGLDGTKSNLPQAASALSVGPELPTNHSPLEQQWHPDLPHSTSLGLGFAHHFAAIEYARSAGRHNDTVVQSGQGKATNIWDAPRQPLPYVSSHVASICGKRQKNAGNAAKMQWPMHAFSTSSRKQHFCTVSQRFVWTSSCPGDMHGRCHCAGTLWHVLCCGCLSSFRG